MAKLEKIKSNLEPQKSAYITTSNDYKISEDTKRDKNREFTFKRKDFMKVNIFTEIEKK